MEVVVGVKRVPDTSENEIELNSAGNDIDRDDLVYSVNEWDNYAVEEALQIVDKVGGSVTVVTVGDDESEEVLRREMAMGADKGVLLKNITASHDAEICAVAFSQRLSLYATAAVDSTLRIWDRTWPARSFASSLSAFTHSLRCVASVRRKGASRL